MLSKRFIFQGIAILALVSFALALSDPADPFSRYRQKIPRIGKKLGDKIMSEYMDAEDLPYESNLSNFFLKSSKAVPRIGRRKDLTMKNTDEKYNIPWNYRQMNHFPLDVFEEVQSPNYIGLPGLQLSEEIQDQKQSEDEFM